MPLPPLWELDQALFRAVHEGARREWLDPALQVVNDMGLGYLQIAALVAAAWLGRGPRWAVAGLLVAVAAAGVVYEARLAPVVALAGLAGVLLFSGRPAALCGLAALVASGLVRLLVVPVAGRQRPSNFDFAQPMEAIFGRSSFPSGHATTSFALAVAVWWCLRGTDRAWVGPAALAIACLVGFGRVYAGVHYPLDVLAAAGLGAAAGSAAYLVWQARGWLEPAAPEA